MRLAADVPLQTERSGKVQSVTRTLSILEALAEYDDGVALSVLARHVGLPLSTTHRLLTTLEERRFVSFDARQMRWSIGLQAFAVGQTFGRARDLVRIGRPIMKMLMESTRETVNLSIADDSSILYLAQVCPAHAILTFARPGIRVPLHTSAAGKCVMAHWSEAEVDRFIARHGLKRRTENSVGSREQLADHLEKAIQEGFARDNQEFASGARCVASPIFNEWGEPIGALSISGPVHRMVLERIAELGAALVDAATRLTDTIGGDAENAHSIAASV